MLFCPITQSGYAGSEEDWRSFGGFDREINEVADTGNVGFEGVESQVKVNLPLVICILGKQLES